MHLCNELLFSIVALAAVFLYSIREYLTSVEKPEIFFPSGISEDKKQKEFSKIKPRMTDWK